MGLLFQHVLLSVFLKISNCWYVFHLPGKTAVMAIVKGACCVVTGKWPRKHFFVFVWDLVGATLYIKRWLLNFFQMCKTVPPLCNVNHYCTSLDVKTCGSLMQTLYGGGDVVMASASQVVSSHWGVFSNWSWDICFWLLHQSILFPAASRLLNLAQCDSNEWIIYWGPDTQRFFILVWLRNVRWRRMRGCACTRWSFFN